MDGRVRTSRQLRMESAGHPMDDWWAAHAPVQHVPLLPGAVGWEEHAAAV
jgi:hypothetical protein